VEIAFAEIERLENILSRHRAGTAVYRLNQTGTVADPPPPLRDVIARALDYAALTGGAFDVTVAPLLELYTDRFARTGAPPSDDDIAAALSLVGWRNLRVTHDAISLDPPAMAVTLDGIAKGYIVDRAVAALVASGADHVLVGASGDMATAGDAGTDEPWHIALQHPRDARRDLGVLRLHGEAVASSGDYMQSFTPDYRFHHILDPHTGRSPERASAASIIARTAMDADALSTAVFVLGPEAGIALLDRLDGIEGMVVTKEGGIITSTGFPNYTG
jgi:thiamine biosynthesis lipoprotein